MTLFVTRLCAARLCAWCDTPPDESLCDCPCHDPQTEAGPPKEPRNPNPLKGTTTQTRGVGSWGS